MRQGSATVADALALLYAQMASNLPGSSKSFQEGRQPGVALQKNTIPVNSHKAHPSLQTEGLGSPPPAGGAGELRQEHSELKCLWGWRIAAGQHFGRAQAWRADLFPILFQTAQKTDGITSQGKDKAFLQVGQVIELAKQWVDVEGSRFPGFLGAHLMGSLNEMEKDAPFALYKDVDIGFVLNEERDRENLVLSYRGLMLEIGFRTRQDYASPEVVLSNPELAPNLITDSILSDPTGLLKALHKTVVKEYARRKWVRARCKWEKQLILAFIEQPGLGLVRAIMTLGGLIAVASLRMPTHRRSLILMKKLLQSQGRLDLHEEALQLLGSAHMDRAEVEFYLRETVEAFDRAVQVYRTPIPYGFKCRAHLRPYIAGASQEMIDEGYHREAMSWIVAAFSLSNLTIQNDAPEAEKAYFQAKYEDLLQALGWNTPQDWQSRQQGVQDLADRFSMLADQIIAANPAIRD